MCKKIKQTIIIALAMLAFCLPAYGQPWGGSDQDYWEGQMEELGYLLDAAVGGYEDAMDEGNSQDAEAYQNMAIDYSEMMEQVEEEIKKYDELCAFLCY